MLFLRKCYYFGWLLEIKVLVKLLMVLFWCFCWHKVLKGKQKFSSFLWCNWRNAQALSKWNPRDVFQCVDGKMHVLGIQVERVLSQVQAFSDKCHIFLYKNCSVSSSQCLSNFWLGKEITGAENPMKPLREEYSKIRDISGNLKSLFLF